MTRCCCDQHRHWPQITSAGLPWIDQVDSGFPEILHVACGQDRAASPANGGDLGVEPLDRQTGAIAVTHDQRIVDRCAGVKGQDIFTKRGEDLIGSSPQAVLAASFGEALKEPMARGTSLMRP
jgi:hypothetical protein